MMIREQLKQALIEALKSKDDKKTATIRLINAAIKDKDIEARPKGITDGIDDNAILSLLQGMIKQRRESIDMYKKGNREDLVAAEQAEIDIISQFLPQQMSEEETKAAIAAIIAKVGATSIKDMGKVMGAVKTEYAGKMDFGAASQLIKAALS